MPVNNARRSPCPVACSLDILGDRWTLLVVRDLFLGKKHFKEFMASPEGISSNILSDRLQRLQLAGILETEISDVHPGRNAYKLTDIGDDLRPVLEAVRDWGLENIVGTNIRMKQVS